MLRLCNCWVIIFFFADHRLIANGFRYDRIIIKETCLKELDAVSDFLWLDSFSFSLLGNCSTKNIRVSINNVEPLHELLQLIDSDNRDRSNLILIPSDMEEVSGCIEGSVINFSLVSNEINAECKPLIIFPEVWYHINKNIWVWWSDAPFNLFTIFAAKY